MDNTGTRKQIALDDRRRTTFTRVGHKDHNLYMVEEFQDGSVLLTPAETVSKNELRMLRDPAVIAALKTADSGDRSLLRPRRDLETKG